MRRVAAGLALLFAIGGWQVASVAPQASGARTVPCVNCHEETSAWSAKRSVHAPVQGEDCLSCHNPHASRHGALLKHATTRTCFTCHEDLAIKIRTEVSHDAAISDRACLSCHDPHASDREGLLADEPAELCAVCHESIVRGRGVAHPHAPVSGGDCLTCHDPHASSMPGLATRAEPTLCTACHDAGDPALRQAHKGIPVDQARCSSCHEPHGTETKGLIRSQGHPPFAEGTCETCHAEAGQAPSALRPGSNDLCTTCHEPQVKGHPIPEEGACVACHTPHVSSTPSLIARRERIICLSCHTETGAQYRGSVAVHPAFGGTQDCTPCHGLHAGQTRDLLKKEDPQAVCATCHAAHAEFSHPMGEGIPDPSHPGHDLGCLSCHDPHGTAFEAFLLADPRRELCLRCHVAEGRAGVRGGR
jgi:predicted CXXCH cytochrome family protein